MNDPPLVLSGFHLNSHSDEVDAFLQRTTPLGGIFPLVGRILLNGDHILDGVLVAASQGIYRDHEGHQHHGSEHKDGVQRIPCVRLNLRKYGLRAQGQGQEQPDVGLFYEHGAEGATRHDD